MRTSAYLLRKYAPAAVGMPRSGEAAITSVESAFPKIHPGRWSGQRDVCAPASRTHTGCGRSPRIHGDGREDFVELTVPMSPMLDGAGNGTSAYLLRKSAPASGDFRRLRLLATNASRLLYARTLAGSSPGTLSKKSTAP